MTDWNDWDALDSAIGSLETALARLENRGDWDYPRDTRLTVKRAREAYSRLSNQWPLAKAALDSQKHAYDAYVTNPQERRDDE